MIALREKSVLIQYHNNLKSFKVKIVLNCYVDITFSTDAKEVFLIITYFFIILFYKT